MDVDLNLSTCVYKHSFVASGATFLPTIVDSVCKVTLIFQLYPHRVPCSYVPTLHAYKNRAVLLRDFLHWLIRSFVRLSLSLAMSSFIALRYDRVVDKRCGKLCLVLSIMVYHYDLAQYVSDQVI